MFIGAPSPDEADAPSREYGPTPRLDENLRSRFRDHSAAAIEKVRAVRSGWDVSAARGVNDQLGDLRIGLGEPV
jgi:hypothetical protein